MLKGVLNWKCDFHVKTRWIPIPTRKHRKNISQPPASGKKLRTRDENCTFKLGISIHDSFDISCILIPFPFVAVARSVLLQGTTLPTEGKNVLLMILMCTLSNDNGNKVLALEALFDSIAPANFYYRYASTWKWRKSIASLSVLCSRSQFSSKTVQTQHKSLKRSRRCRAKARVIFNIMSMCFPVTSTTN